MVMDSLWLGRGNTYEHAIAAPATVQNFQDPPPRVVLFTSPRELQKLKLDDPYIKLLY